MAKRIRKTFIYLALPLLLSIYTTGVGFSQPTAQEEKIPSIRFGRIDFSVREFQSTPSLLKMLEIHVEVFNKSRETTAPPNSVKLVMVPKETKYPEGSPPAGFEPAQEEATLTVPLPPNTGRILIFGFSLPEKIPESITFEFQINPPEGEKKTVTWQRS
jgi:hypothetical protein